MTPSNFAGRGSGRTFCVLLLTGLCALTVRGADALVNYVKAPDDSYAWSKLEERAVGETVATRLELTSQTWHGHVWKHQMLVVRPAQLRNPDIAFLLISGDGDVTKSFGLLELLAKRAGGYAAVINRVPNQPLYNGRKEDALIAYTFEQYIKTGDKTWPLLFPMAKSAVRAMDTLQALAKQTDQKVERFVVGGASKRGWTTWLSAVADERVKAIAPMVIDMLNMKAQTQWAKQMYGRQSEEISDYTEYDFAERMDEPGMVELRQWVDPYSYRKQYKLPKLLLLGTNDPYWVVDSLRHYWDELPEPKLVYQTPNAGHNLGGGKDAQQTLAAFFQMIADRQALPDMRWRMVTNSEPGVRMEVSLSQPAQSFRIWTASSEDRDFRDEKWSSSELGTKGGKAAQATIRPPREGFRAYFIEAELAAPTGGTYRLSTEARVIPDGVPQAHAARQEKSGL
ncbi:MAG TPA: PhoPQ-activated protein PqaA family protein [Clostridia bacterium]|nr:PhoPQ-activated protein PqaA family protein [Clostridia bacterium]